MPKNYIAIDRRTTQVLATFPGVLDPVPLTGVETTSGSNVITVASTTGVFPGMLISCEGIPYGAEVKSVPSATTLELQLSVWTGSTTQAFSLSPANAEATASASGLLARASGYNPVSRVCWVPKGTWRNLPTSSGFVKADLSTVTIPGLPFVVHPTFTPGTPPTLASLTTTTSDLLATTPALRDKMEPWGVVVFVGALGFEMTLPYDPQNMIVTIEEEEV